MFFVFVNWVEDNLLSLPKKWPVASFDLLESFTNEKPKKMANALCASSKRIQNKIQFNRKIVLGIGNSVVFQGKYQGQKIAVKRILLNPSNTEDDENLKTHTKLDHENVLKILIVEDDLDFRSICS